MVKDLQPRLFNGLYELLTEPPPAFYLLDCDNKLYHFKTIKQKYRLNTATKALEMFQDVACTKYNVFRVQLSSIYYTKHLATLAQLTNMSVCLVQFFSDS